MSSPRSAHKARSDVTLKFPRDAVYRLLKARKDNEFSSTFISLHAQTPRRSTRCFSLHLQVQQTFFILITRSGWALINWILWIHGYLLQMFGFTLTLETRDRMETIENMKISAFFFSIAAL